VKTFRFEKTYQDTKTSARTGVIHTPHGPIQTPAFVPVGTQATVKSLTSQDLQELDTHLFFVNTYHMYLRPGLDVIVKAQGLHAFMGWDRPIITDSGGFQVFSLGRKKFVSRKNAIDSQDPQNKDDQHESPSLVQISDDGVTFRSHWDGSKHVFTPELSMQYQWTLGSDIHIAFDDCTPYPVTEKLARTSMERTHRWAVRSIDEHEKLAEKSRQSQEKYQALYGSIQGSVYEHLRKESVQFITSCPFDGFAIGGVAVGESKAEMKKILQWVTPYLPQDKPRHLLGVGEIDDVFELIEHGMDTFDCVQPTRLARMGRLFTMTRQKYAQTYENASYEIDITRPEYKEDMNAIDATCPCYTCTHASRAYIHHLFKVRELLAYRLATIHNISFMNRLVNEIRLAIQRNSFVALKKKWLGVA